MAENVIHVRTTRAKIRQAIAKAVAVATGAGGDGREAADQMKVRLGLTLLANIRKAFVVKAAGGTDEAGLSWKPLSPKTIAYSRRHPGVPKSKDRAPFRPSWMLTEKQHERWWSLYRTGLARFRGDKGRAAKLAWAVMKGEGAKTLIGTYGNTAVQILRDTGLLLNSLTPGLSPEGDVPSSPPTVENQVFTLGSSDVIVGTNRKHAATHHEGKGHVPQRRLWAEPSQWPQTWWNDISDAGKTGMVDILLHLLRNP